MMRSGLTAVGVTCGIGSMLVGARQSGFDVLGNVEWRRYYHASDDRGRNTFTENFPGAAFKRKIEDLDPVEIEKLMNPTLAIGHPECGNFSQLSSMNPNKTDDPGDIPLFVDIVARLRPRFFVMDDLPKSFIAFPMKEYVDRLPDYDLFPEWISNYHYGNVQKNRRRMFMLGSLKSEGWAFVPGEFEHKTTLRDILEELGEPRVGSNWPNHDPHVLDDLCGRAKHLVTLGRDRVATYADLRDYFLSVPEGVAMEYVSHHAVTEGAAGSRRVDDLLVKHKPGHARSRWDGHAYVLDGASIQVHPVRGLPYTIRERAKIQGFPDDFVFYGTRLNAAGEWNHERNNDVVKMTGKAMPVQFCRYVTTQIAAHVRGETFEASGARLVGSNDYVDRAKRWYCEEVGYADQELACSRCWLYASCTIRQRKYQIGEAVVGQMDLYDPGVVPGPDVTETVVKVGRVICVPPKKPPRRPAASGSTAAARRPLVTRFADISREEEFDL